MPGALQQALILIRAASLLVPASYRESWRSEWESEAWHAWIAMQGRGETPAFMRRQLRHFCKGSIADAAWYLWNMFDAAPFERAARSPGFCVIALALVIGMIGLTSGWFPATRAVVLPLPYAAAGRIATVSQGGMSLAMRSGIPVAWTRLWQSGSKVIDGAATYRWSHSASGGHARISDNFFELLGAKAYNGRTFERGDEARCPDCAVLSHDYARRLGVQPGSRVTIDGHGFKVIGVLHPRFWFLSRHIGWWTLAEAAEGDRTGVAVRLRDDITPAAAQNELESIVHAAGFSPWEGLVDVSMLGERVRAVFGSFALALILAVVITVAGLRPRLPQFQPGGWMRALFMASKVGLALTAVLLAGLEFTRAASITMIGGTDLATEPLSTWLFLIGSMGALSWSIFDQRRRCRVCVRRLGLAAHVGCPGCLLLNWAGTELVCIEGHGMLHVPEMVSSWHADDQWTALDDSWLELFAKKPGLG